MQDELQRAYERLQRDSSREVSRLRKQCDGLARELQEQKAAADELFEKVLRDKNLPNGFAEGLDEFGI